MSPRRRAALWPCLALLLAGPAALGGVLSWHLFYDRHALPDLEAFERFELPQTGLVLDARDAPLAELAREHREQLSSAQVPPVVRAAIIAGEDNRFFAHSGVDFRSFPRVVLRDLLHGLRGSGSAQSRPFAQGGSTITQQLVRGYFLRDLVLLERGPLLLSAGPIALGLRALFGVRAANKLLRKVEEIRLSLWLEEALLAKLGTRAQVKEAILLRYVNLVYLGEGRYGFGDACSHWFSRPLSSLTSEDAPLAALLAARLRRPSESDPRALLARRNRVLARMAVNGFFPETEALRHQESPYLPGASPAPLPAVPGVLKAVLGELRQSGLGLGDLLDGRVRVKSTVDARIQTLARTALATGLTAYAQRHKGSPEAGARGPLQGAVVVLANSDAAVLAELGARPGSSGADEGRYTDFDRALEAQRQPGSVMKAFVYLAALRGRFTLDAEVNDAPITVSMGLGRPGKWITNYDGRFQGAIPLRRALAQSRNAATVWLARRVGMGAVLETARDLGIETELARYPSTALGASGVTLLELANAYRAMASGVRARPHFVRGLEFPREGDGGAGNTPVGSSGRFLPATAALEGPLGITPAQLALIQEGLRGVVRLPGGTAHSLDTPEFPVPVMGKTGTTSQFRDALFVGSTYGKSGITVAVWLGFDDGTPLGPRESGAKVALPIFRELVHGIYAQKLAGPAPRFPLAVEGGIDGFLHHARTLAEARITRELSATAENLPPPPLPGFE